MGIETVGPWVFLGMGVIVVLATVYKLLATKPAPGKITVLFLVFGVLLMGLGVYGLEFFDPYTEFLKIVAMEKDQGEKTYGEFLDSVASGDMPEEYRKIGLTYMERNPITDIEKLLDGKIESASDPEGKAQLIKSREILTKKANLAESFAGRPDLSGDEIRNLRLLDPYLDHRVREKLLTLPDDKLRELGVDRAELMETRGGGE